MQIAKKREAGVDLVRVVALGLLLWLHYWLRNGFYSQPVDSAAAVIAVAFRPLFMCCVPLFMVLTGYLKCGKLWSRSYYRSLVPILISYLLISLIFLAHRLFFLGESNTLTGWLALFFDFKLANYGWYIEMYIGVFLLSPFLNAMWVHLRDREMHRALILTFVLLTFLPTFLGELLRYTIFADLHPYVDYWKEIFYLGYYLIGCYIKSWKPKIHKGLGLTLLAGLMAVQAWLHVMTRTDPASYYSGFAATYGNLFIACMTILVFLLFYDIPMTNSRIQRALAFISGITLEIYLCSRLVDPTIYTIGYGTYGPEAYLWRGILSTSAVFLITTCIAWPVHIISRNLSHRR